MTLILFKPQVGDLIIGISLYMYNPQKHTFSNFDVRAFSISEFDISKQLLLLPFLFFLLHKNIIELEILNLNCRSYFLQN